MQAMMRVASREDPQHELPSEPQHVYHKAVKFYQHGVNWTNRTVLGDSLQVMAGWSTQQPGRGSANELRSVIIVNLVLAFHVRRYYFWLQQWGTFNALCFLYYHPLEFLVG